MTETSTDRRAFLRRAATGAGAAATAGLASGTATAQSGPDYGGWFDGTTNYEGTYDFTGQSEVTVAVGSKANNAYFGFNPAAIRVDPGTTVVWKWTGKGNAHNVVASDGSFKSDLYSAAGQTFEHTFQSEGTYTYYCQPHKALGMKGAVVVGGSGGLDPGTVSQPLLQSGGGGGEGGEGGSGASDQEATHAAEQGHGGGAAGFLTSFEGLTFITTLALGLLSPIFFAIVLVLNQSASESESESAGPPAKSD